MSSLSTAQTPASLFALPIDGAPPALQSLAPTSPQLALAGRVLVVDDEPYIVRALTRVLTSAGHEVKTASNGEEAVEMFRQGGIEVVVSDVAMPRMDGLRLLRKLREVDLDVPVILVTAGPTVESAMQAVEHGAFRYLTKPVDIDELTKVVNSAVGLSRMAKVRREALESAGTLAQQIGDRAGLMVKFSSALQKLWMAYQPIVQWSTRSIYAYEALVRSKEATLPHPGALFDAAERLGKVMDLGRAIRSAVVPPGTGPGAPLLFVNLTTLELEDDALYLPDSPLALISSSTVLEVTERASLDSVKDVRTRIAALRAMGFRIALDDIGAGYAGLSSFAVLEPEVVKIDMSLVRDVHASPIKQKLIRSLTTLGDGMGQRVIAEGVETVTELQTLIDLGCDLFQGYLFARPGAPFPTVNWPELK